MSGCKREEVARAGEALHAHPGGSRSPRGGAGDLDTPLGPPPNAANQSEIKVPS